MPTSKRLFVLGLLLLLLVACGSADQEPASQPSLQAAQSTATPSVATEAPPPEPSSTIALPELTEGQEEDAGMVTVKEIETLAVATEMAEAPPATEMPATVTAAPQMNGQYEGTFYRGLATAPITMIDYSDFL